MAASKRNFIQRETQLSILQRYSDSMIFSFSDSLIPINLSYRDVQRSTFPSSKISLVQREKEQEPLEPTPLLLHLQPLVAVLNSFLSLSIFISQSQNESKCTERTQNNFLLLASTTEMSAVAIVAEKLRQARIQELKKSITERESLIK